MSRRSDRLRNPAPWLGGGEDPPRYFRGRRKGSGPRPRRRLGLLDLGVVALVLVAVWSRTPVGAFVQLAFAQVTGAPTDGIQPLTAYFDTGAGDAAAVEAMLARTPILHDDVPEGGLPQPWRTAASTALDGHLPAPARDALATARIEDPDATVLDVLDALYEDDPAEALEVFAIGAEARERAITRARAAGEADAESWHGHRTYLPLSTRLSGDRTVGRVLALGTALDLTWPVDDRFRMTSPFGERVHPTLKTRKFHNGVDLAVPIGTPVRAAQSGRVRVGEDGVSGKYVVVDHGHGVRTSYCHLSEVHVTRGQEVDAGTPVALSGNTGRSTGPHLHFTVRVGKRPVDPAALRRVSGGPDPGS